MQNPLTNKGKKMILIAVVILLLGNILMYTKPSVAVITNNPVIFSPIKTVIAPIVLLAGYVLIIVGIMNKTAE